MLTNKPPVIIRSLRYLHYFAGVFLFLFLVIITLNTVVITSYTVHGHSMDPTLHDGEILGISLINYFISAPSKNDIIVLYFSGDPTVHFVKRITNIPGETVSYQGYQHTLASDEFFVEGDNRSRSTDSRSYGPVNRNQIIGKVIWPIL